jgi:anaerobic selenocysteine-containing dehydrogenase
VGLEEVMAGSARDWKQRLIAPTLGPHGITVDDFSDGGQAVRSPLSPRVLFADRRFATPTGKVNLLQGEGLPAEALEPPAAPDGFPLRLMALSTEKAQSSQWSEKPEGPAVVTVHPEAAPGIADGALGVLESARGSLTVRVVHDRRQRTDVLLALKGGHLRDGQCMNALISARTTDMGEGGALYDEWVRVTPLRT